MRRCDIIIPIYNALDCLKECIDTVLKNTDLNENGLILIDDKSPDENVRVYLRELEKEVKGLNVDILYNETNLGFVGTVNKGMKYSKNDVLLLNSDTEVPNSWLERIKKCAYSDKTISTVTALSNNATLVSVPIGLQVNTIPNKYTFEEYAKVVCEASYLDYPELPTSHGFCMFIKREVLDLIGYFNEEKFGRGYGEENDFSFRCLDYGFRNVVCDDVIVLHKESQSFLDDKSDLIKNNLKLLHDQYPAYSQKINLWCQEFPLKKVCDNIFYNIQLRERKNILFLIHDFENPTTHIGGTTIHCMDLIKELRSKYNFHVLYPSDGVYKVHSFFETEERILPIDGIVTFSAMSYYNNDYKKLVEQVIKGLQIDMVHIHHMIGHYFDVVDVCNENNIKTAITLHDFYCLCPTINMLYDMEKYCLDIDSKQRDCATCLHHELRITNNIMPIWQKRWQDFLGMCDVVITPSKSTKEIVESIYSNINCQAIEHGIKSEDNHHMPDTNSEDFNVAFVGVMAKHKGAKVVEHLISDTKNNNIKYHVFGMSEYGSLEKDTNNYTYHGRYDRDSLPQLLKDNNIHMVCNLSIWPETYSYTLTETIASGIPVLALNIGAVGQRINEYKFGWTVDSNSSNDEILNKIVEISENQTDYLTKLKNICDYHVKTIKEMASEYKNIYTTDSREFDAASLRELLEACQGEQRVGYNPQLDEILNSRRWKLVSRIQLPEFLKKVSRKLIK